MYDYRKQLTWAKLRIGIIITGALVVLFFAVLFAGNIEKLFTPRVTFHATFDDVKGLRAGAPVWFAGVQVGSVRSLELTADEKIVATISVERDVLPFLKRDSRARIQTLGLLGDKYVEMSMGSREEVVLQPGDMVQGVAQAEIGEELSQLVDRIESERGTIGRLMSEDKLYRDLAASVRDIRHFARTLKTSEGTVNKFIKDPAVYERFLKASESLDTFTKKLTNTKGTVHRLIEDKSLYENMNSASEKLSSVLKKIDDEEGAFGSLISDGEIKKELRSTIKEINSLVKDIRKEPKKYFSFSVF